MRKWLGLLVLFLVSLPLHAGQPVAVQLYTPNAVEFAMGDLATIPAADQPYIRWLSLYNLAAEDRPRMAETLSFLMNSLGRRKRMYPPLFVGASDQTLVRVDIRNYDWPSEAWEELTNKGSGPRPQPEPYFHARVVKIVETKKQIVSGYDQYNRPTYKTEVNKSQKVQLAPGPWLDEYGIQTLMKATYSSGPIMRADWFIANASLGPRYYEFLGLGTKQSEFVELVGGDPKKAQQKRGQDKGVVITSMVTRNNRTLNRSPTFTKGYLWISHDSLTSVDERQYIRNPLDEKFDATEEIGTLPNGLQAYYLTDGKGNRLDEANPNIAQDRMSPDMVVRTAKSCIICHADGIRPIEDEIRAMTKAQKNKEGVRLLIAKEEDYYRMEDLFDSDLDEQVVQDQNLYARAVARANGLKPDVNAKLFAHFYDGYVEKLLGREEISRELGVTPVDVERYIRKTDDPVALGLIRQPIRPIRRDQWEKSFQNVMAVMVAEKAKK